MRSGNLTLIAIAALSVAQSTDNSIPQCAQSCIAEGANSIGCDPNELQCLCDPSRLFNDSITTCLSLACDETDLSNFEIALYQICATGGSTPTTAASENGTTTATDEPSAQSTTATSLAPLVSSYTTSMTTTSSLSRPDTTTIPSETHNPGTSSSTRTTGHQTSLPVSPPHNKTLTSGAAAGIAVGAIVGVAALIGAIWLYLRKRRTGRDGAGVIGPLNNNEAGYFENMKPELSDSSVAGRMTATTADYPGGEKLSPKTVSEEIKTPRIDVTAIMKPQQTVTSSYSHESDISPLCDELSGSSVSELASRSRHPGVVPGYEPGSRNEAVSYPAQELDAYPRRQDQGVDTIQELAEYPQYTRPYDAPEAVQQGMTHSTLDPTFDVQTSASQPGLEVVPQPTSTRALDGPQERRMSELLAEQQKIQEEVSRLKRLQALADEERRVQDEIQRYAGSGQRG